VPINSWPVDQSAFTRITFVLCEPKMAAEVGPDGVRRPTGVQQTSADGLMRKWNVQAVFSQPSRFDSARTESEVKDVTVTSVEDPGASVNGGDIRFVGLAAGAMAPEQSESGRIRGGKIFLSATGVQSASGVGKRGES
jgi:hypothetical protein